MWEGLKGNRLKNGTRSLVIGIIVSSILLFGSFYIYFLYLLIPVVLVIIFHYTKSWRYTDRSFYGLIAIVIAFFIAVSGISYTIANSPSHSEVIYHIGSYSYDIHFNYSNVNNNYSFFISMPANNISSNANITLLNLFTGSTFIKYNLTMIRNGSNFNIFKNLGHLAGNAYVINFTFFSIANNSSQMHFVQFLGPILVPLYEVVFAFAKSLLITYLVITYIFFLVFAYLARMIGNTRKRNTKGKGTPPDKDQQGEVLEESNKKN